MSRRYCQLNGAKLLESLQQHLQTSPVAAGIISYAVALYFLCNIIREGRQQKSP